MAPARVDTQECDAAMETTRETKRKAEQLHDAVAALDAHAHKVRKTEAGRSAASKSSAAAEADAEKATKAAERAVEKAARLAAAATAWDAQLNAEQAASDTLQEAVKEAMEAAGL